MTFTGFDFIIPILSALSSFLILLYTIVLAKKSKNSVFGIAIVMSLLFLFISVGELALMLFFEVEFNQIVISLPIFALIMFWGILLFVFYEELKKRFGSVAINDMQRIEKTEKEYLSKMYKKFSSKGKEPKDNNTTGDITDPFFTEIKRPLFIVGMKDVGKSTMGRILGVKLAVNFLDLDDLLLKSIQHKYPSLKYFYDVTGKDNYMKTETMCLYNYFKSNNGNIIVALGESACDNASLMKLAHTVGDVVHIYIEKDSLYRRVITSGVLPPYVDKSDPKKSFDEVYQKRYDIYKSYADINVELSEKCSTYDNAYRILSAVDAYFSSPQAYAPKINKPNNTIRLKSEKEPEEE